MFQPGVVVSAWNPNTQEAKVSSPKILILSVGVQVAFPHSPLWMAQNIPSSWFHLSGAGIKVQTTPDEYLLNGEKLQDAKPVVIEDLMQESLLGSQYTTSICPFLSLLLLWKFL